MREPMQPTFRKDAPVKILHVITTLEPGGAEIMLCKILSRMDRSKFTHAVVSLTDRGRVADEIRALGIPVYSLGMVRGVPNPLALFRLMRIIKAEKPTILQTWLYHSDLLGVVAGKLMRIPVILWNIRCSELGGKDRSPLLWLVLKILAILSRLPAAIVTNSQAGRLVSERLGYRSGKWVIIPNGFDLDLFRPSEESRRDVRRELGLDSDTPLIGLVARFHAMKDHTTFLEAAAKLRAIQPGVHFVLAGKDVSIENPVLKEQVDSLNLGRRVHLMGERLDIPAITASLDIATCSSYTEGFPNVIGEAMACGIPCVATDVGDCRNIIGDTGIIVPSRDPQALADGWARLLSLSADERAAMGARGRERVASLFDIGQIVRKYEDLYHQLARDLG